MLSAVPWLCSFFQESGNAPPDDGGASAFILTAACLLFLVLLYFLPACLIIITRQHTHTHRSKKKAGSQTHPQNLPKKRETTPLKTDVFLPLFSAHTRTDGRTHRKLKVTGLNYCIKKNIQVSNNTAVRTVRTLASSKQQAVSDNKTKKKRSVRRSNQQQPQRIYIHL